MSDENDILAQREVKMPTTDLETFIHLVKGALGSGIWAMPFAFKNIGLWVGIPATIIVGLVCTFSLHLVVTASHTLSARCRIPKLSYSDIAEQAFLNDPKEMKKMAIASRILVDFFISLNNLGCVIIYLVNTGVNLKQVMDYMAADNGISLRILILIISLPLFLLCLIRNLKHLVPFSMAANILLICSILIAFTFILKDLPSPAKEEALASDYTQWPVFFGISLFAIECINVAIPLENEMKHPRHFSGCPSVLSSAMTIVIILYTTLGFLGHLKYGDKTEANIAINLPVDSLLAKVVKVMVALAVYFTILLQFYAPTEITWNLFKDKVPENRRLLVEFILRICLMLFCVGIAVAFPNLGPLISLIGAVCLSTLGLIVPATLDIVVTRIDPGYGPFKFRLVRDTVLLILGVIAFISGAIVSLADFGEK